MGMLAHNMNIFNHFLLYIDSKGSSSYRGYFAPHTTEAIGK